MASNKMELSGLFVDDEEDEVFVGPVTFRENISRGLRSNRKTEVFAVKLRESLLLYREQKDNADCSTTTETENKENCITEYRNMHHDCVTFASKSVNDGMEISTEEDDTYYTCCQSLRDGEAFSESVDIEHLVVPPTSRASSCEPTELYDDLSIEVVEKHSHKLSNIEISGQEDAVSDVQDVENKCTETALVALGEELRMNEEADEVEVKNRCLAPVKVAQSCQTSFINYECQNEEKTQSSSPFKTPLAVTKRFNKDSTTNSNKNRFLKVPTSASPKRKPLSSPSGYGSKRFDHIKSPIAKYINDAPTPPLIVNIRSNDAKTSKIPTPMKDGHNLRSKTTTNNVIEEQKTSPSALSAVSDESILERFGLTKEEFEKLEDKSLKVAFKKYIKEEKRNSILNIQNCNDENVKLIPVTNYKGPTALAAVPVRKEIDLLTKLTTYKNSRLPLPSPKPVIMKHIGERKKLHWDRNVMSAAKKTIMETGISSPSVLINLPQRLDDSCMYNEGSMVEVSMVEVVSSPRTNTLFKK